MFRSLKNVSTNVFPFFTMSPTQYISHERFDELTKELHTLKTVSRREIADRLEAAKALGDLSENAEYHEAKDSMAMLDGRIFELEELLKTAKIIDSHVESNGTVRIGSTVTVEVNGKEKSFHIVGSSEADPAAGRISNESPIGSALLGATEGSVVMVTTPGGQVAYRIKKVS